MKIIEIKAPNEYKTLKQSLNGIYGKVITLFLSGSIDQGSAKDWQAETKKYLENYEGEDDTAVILINPRRDDWNCVDSETKAVTKRGILSYDELTEDDEILTYNLNGYLEYQKPININVYNVSDINLHSFTYYSEKFLYTDNHNVVSRKSSRDNSFGIYSVNNYINNSELRTPRPILEDVNEKYVRNDIVKYNSNHIKLSAWFLSEGSVIGDNVCIYQYESVNPHKVIKIKKNIK